jgi:hypothetical protein
VLIWYMWGNENARQSIEQRPGFAMSVVTYMGLGMLRAAVRRWEAKVLYLDYEISARAAAYVEAHFLSQSLQLADAPIGATAVVDRIQLLAADDRHYQPDRRARRRQVPAVSPSGLRCVYWRLGEPFRF